MIFSRLLTITALACGLTTPALAERVSVLVFDASGSMWNRVEGDLTRIEVARDVIGDYFATRDGAVPLSVIAYGHNRRGDCGDIEVIAPMGQTAPGELERRLRALMPRGMTPLTDSLAMARDQIPPTAEAADIILVTDGLETCEGDPCALAARLAAEGIDIRAHVVGFGLTRVEVEALSCITEQTGGMLFETNSGAELAEALQQVSAAVPEPVAEPEPEPQPEAEAAFDIGDRAEAGFIYTIHWRGEASWADYLGFVPQGEDGAPSSPGFGPINVMRDGGPSNPVTRTAPSEPGFYDLIIRRGGQGVIARQAVEVVPPAMGFDPIGSVEPGSRFNVRFRGPEQGGERLTVARPDQPVSDFRSYSWDFALSKNGVIRVQAPDEPGEYELRYLNASATEVMFSRRFGVGIPFEDADATTSADLAAQATEATRGDATQDSIAEVPATFRLPADVPDGPVSWRATPQDSDMSSEIWSPGSAGAVVTGSFEPGNWLILAQMPGHVDFSAWVEIFPGQPNDFTLEREPTSLDGALEGAWTVWGIPPREVNDPPMVMMEVDLRLTDERQDYIGTFATSTAMGGQVITGDLTSVTMQFESLYITFALPQIAPEPFRLALGPQGMGYVGPMSSGQHSLPVALWRTGVAEDLALWQDAAYGSGNNYVPEFAFTCTEPRCEVVIERLSVTLEQGWSMTEPSWISATAGANPLSHPRAEFHGPDGAMIMLNPHQWLADNGPCLSTVAGGLCLWRDGPAAAAAAAVPLSMSLRIVEEQAQVNEFRGLAVALPGVPQEAQVSMEVRLTAGEDAMDIVTYNNAVQQLRQPYRIGNRYDIRAEYQGREFLARDVEIVFGPDAQVVRLSPQVFSYEFEVSANPPTAGTPGYFGVTVTAPEGFDGSFELHPEWERDGPPLFAMGAEEWLGGQDQVLPVPAIPGDYELRYLDADGAMIGAALITVPNAEGQGSMAIEPDDGTRFGNYGPYLAGAEVLVQVRRGDDRRPGDQVVVLRTGSDRALPGTGEWIDDFRVRIRMPDAPGDYMLALSDTDGPSLRALTPAPVEAAPVPSFWRYNANPVPDRPFGVVAVGRMALSDRMAIVAPSGAVVVEAPLLEAMTGRMRLPADVAGPHELHYIGEGQVLARVALDIDGPSPLVPAGGSDGPAVISMEGAMVPGGAVQVSLRGMIPEESIVGFLRPGTPSRTILQTSSRASPESPVVMLNVPQGEGPWALRLTDHNLTQIAEIIPGAGAASPAASPAGSPPQAGLIPIQPRDGASTADVLNFLLPGFISE
ncbi:vWA domain-containing protein [Pararhodobacter sp.]|uniref:vWA domain-containing protein n=1 Tax=Pararhodobacter sp. TaxID=2127056 RepID=UPI002FDEFE5C